MALCNDTTDTGVPVICLNVTAPPVMAAAEPTINQIYILTSDTETYPGGLQPKN